MGSLYHPAKKQRLAFGLASPSAGGPARTGYTLGQAGSQCSSPGRFTARICSKRCGGSSASPRSPGLRRGGGAERTVAVGVEPGELAVDVDGVAAVEVHVLVVGGPDVSQHGVIDVPPRAPQGGDGQAVVSGWSR